MSYIPKKAFLYMKKSKVLLFMGKGMTLETIE